MPRKVVRSTVTIAFAVILLISVVASPVAAAPNDEKDDSGEGNVDAGTQFENPALEQAKSGVNKAAATRVRKAFLQAKKAFHEARKDIQSIKKGEESPVKDVPTFFDSEDDD